MSRGRTLPSPRSRLARACALALLAGVACDHSAAPSSGTSANTGDAGQAPGASLRIDAGPSKPAPAPAVESWRGNYHSAPGELYIPPDWTSVHFVVKDRGEGVGDGDLTLRVDTARGRVEGALEGPLGPAMLEGVTSNGSITASIRRAHPEDQGFTGTLFGKIAGDALEGTMNLTEPDVSAVRAATFHAGREHAAP